MLQILLQNYFVLKSGDWDGDKRMDNSKRKQFFEENFEGGEMIMKLWWNESENKYLEKSSRTIVM